MKASLLQVLKAIAGFLDFAMILLYDKLVQNIFASGGRENGERVKQTLLTA